MPPRSLSSHGLALGLLIGSLAPGLGLSSDPPPPLPPTEPVVVGVDPGPISPAPFEAVPASPWYADAEMAVLFNTGVCWDGQVYSVKDQNSVFVSPRAFLGYAFDGGGSARFTYRNLTEVANVGGRGRWDETFTVNWFDLDYVSRECVLDHGWVLRWEAGGRFVYRYSANRYDSPYSASEFRSSYFGGGPHLGLTTRCPLGESAWSVLGRADTGITFGGGAREDRYLAWGLDWLTIAPVSQRRSYSGYQYDVNFQLGLLRDWQLDACSIRLGLGAQAELLSIGDFRGGAAGDIGLINVGPFLRGEVAF